MENKYAIRIYWSDEDKSFVAICEDFPGLSAFGENREEALAEAQIALDLFIETYRSKGIELPKPSVIVLEAA